jgi:predicted ATPase/DNA-binding winged helix-turn-helix (wHTH) protein
MGNAESLPTGAVISFGPFRLYPAERLLKRHDETLPVGGRALDILIALVERAGEVVTRQQLISRVWPDVAVVDANLRIHVAGLRKVLGHGRGGPRYIVNIPGRGYSFVAPVVRSLGHGPGPSRATTDGDQVEKFPPQLNRMIGRDDTTRIVSAQLMMWRFVSIVGAGGMGKTTVAISVARALLDGFNGAVFFIDLAALTDAELVPIAVASALGFMVQTQDPVPGLLTYIGDRKLLLVLDNCEHVIDVAAPLAERVVSEAPQAHVLTTSREALRVQGEHVHLLHALDYPPDDPHLTAAAALTYPAVELFMERAAASGYSAELSDADAPIAARICRRLDGIALAIELAGSRVGLFGIQRTEELLNNRFMLLWHGRRTARPRHQTLNAMLDWSYNLLSEHEKVVLCRLSVFVGEFTLEAAHYVASEADVHFTGAVVSLVAKSLMSVTEINGRTYYRLLDTTRAYATTKLGERGEADRIARRHAISYSQTLERDDMIQSTFGERDLSGYTPHIGNVRAALRWALADRGDVAVGIDLAAYSAPLFIGLSLLEECRRWCERALAALGETGSRTRQEVILQEALALSSMFTSGHGDQIRGAIDRALALAEDFQDRPRQLRLLAGLNLYLMRLGDFPGALAVAEQGGSIAQGARLPAGTVWAEWMVGMAQHLLGDQAAAQLHCGRALALEVELGTARVGFFGYGHRVGTLVGFARVLWLRGLSDQALRITQLAIDEAARQDHPVSTSISLVYASTIFLWTGDLPRAGELIEQVITYAGQHSLRPYSAAGIGLKGELAVIRGEAETGIDLLRTALEALRAEQYNVVITVFIGALAEGLRKIGQLEEALLTIDGALERATSSGAAFYLAELLRIKACILAADPRPDRTVALDCLAKSLAVAREQSALALELRSATSLARLLFEAGQRDQAHHVLAPVYRRFTEGSATSDLRIARQLIEDLATTSLS